MNITTNQGLFKLKKADLTNQEDLEAIAKMELAIKKELRPHFKFDFSNKEAFNGVVKAIKQTNQKVNALITYTNKNPTVFLSYSFNDYRKIVDYGFLFVYPEFRKLGVGGALLDAGEEDAKSKNYNSIYTYASAGAQPLYRKKGFNRVGSDSWGELMIRNLK